MIADRAMMWLAQTTARPSGGPSRLYTPNSSAPGQVDPASVEAGASILPGAAASAGQTTQVALTPEQIVEAARLSPWMALTLIAVSLLITAGVLWGAFWWWRVKNEFAGEVAFRLLARRMGLGPADRSLVQQAAARSAGVPAVALLVSPSALDRALVSESA